MEGAVPFLVVTLGFMLTTFLGIMGWSLTRSVKNQVEMGRIVERMQAVEEANERRHESHERRFQQLEQRP